MNSRAAIAGMVVMCVCVLAGAVSCAEAEAYRPRPTLTEDMAGLTVPLVRDYAGEHPRLLLATQDRDALRKKATAQPQLWAEVLASSSRLGNAAPDSKEVRSGRHYWRIERVQSAALAWFVTGEKSHMDAALRWMRAYCAEDVWGDGDWRPNIDLQASWYIYHIGAAYDVFYDKMSDTDRKAIRDGLAAHTRAIYESWDPAKAGKIRYDQNHTYIPVTAMVAGALVLLDDVPEAAEWLKRGYAIMRRCRYVLGDDGYYYEGTGYWAYAMSWHVRYAEMISRATGRNAFDLPILRENWMMPLYLSLPASPVLFDLGDSGRWSGARPPQRTGGPNNCSMYWAIAKANASAVSKSMGDILSARWPERDYPASAFLWFTDEFSHKSFELPLYHYFPDHGIVSWRSGWDKDDTVYLFRCGPPMGHKAAVKLTELRDWTMNCGHVHPDIGAFWMYSKGAYLATDTGYTAKKFTRDHNTLLVDGLGQAVDGTYHNERGVPYSNLDGAKIDRVHMEHAYGFVSGEFGSAYRRQVKGVSLRRTLLMTKEWLLVVDDMAADAPHKLTWLCHAYAPFEKKGAAQVARLDEEKVSLAVIPLGGGSPATVKGEKTTVLAGTGPGQGTPTHRGFHLDQTTTEPAAKARLISLLVPLADGQKLPAVSCTVDAAGVLTLRTGAAVSVRVNLNWDGKEGEPAVWSRRRAAIPGG